jgi:hypothetical protein
MAKRKLTTEERRRLREAFAGMRADVGELRSLLEASAERLRQAEADEVRRRARIRRLTFGLLGREPQGTSG